LNLATTVAVKIDGMI